MLKKNKTQLMITSLVALLPMLFGLLLWNRLPATIATHFGTSGTPDGWSSKAFAVFGLPCILLAAHLVCTLATLADPRRKSINPRLWHILLWVCPLLSVVVNSSIYLYALGLPIDMGRICCLVVGLLFLLFGNYLPKCRQNSTVGIKLPWTLADQANWNSTHRFAGWLWVAAGLVMLLALFVPAMFSPAVLFGTIAAVALLPVAYSFVFFVRHRAG